MPGEIQRISNHVISRMLSYLLVTKVSGAYTRRLPNVIYQITSADSGEHHYWSLWRTWSNIIKRNWCRSEYVWNTNSVVLACRTSDRLWGGIWRNRLIKSMYWAIGADITEKVFRVRYPIADDWHNANLKSILGQTLWIQSVAWNTETLEGWVTEGP